MRVSFPLAALGLGLSIVSAGIKAAETPSSEDANSRVCATLRADVLAHERELNSRRINEYMFEGADKGCVSVVADMLTRGAALEARDRFGNTVLIHAAGAGHENVLAHVLGAGAAIDAANLAGSTALSRAVAGNHRDAVEMLLGKGAKLSGVNRSGVTPLAAAAYNGDGRMLVALLEKGADPGEPDGTGKGPILYAAGLGDEAIVAALLDAGLDVNKAYGHGLTALMWAAGHANNVPAQEGLSVTRLLVEHGATIDPVDDRGRTALMIAAERGHAEIAAFLVEKGTDLFASRQGRQVRGRPCRRRDSTRGSFRRPLIRARRDTSTSPRCPRPTSP